MMWKKNTFSSPTSIQPNECYNLSVIFIKISYKYFSVLCIFDSKWVKQRINQLGRNQWKHPYSTRFYLFYYAVLRCRFRYFSGWAIYHSHSWQQKQHIMMVRKSPFTDPKQYWSLLVIKKAHNSRWYSYNPNTIAIRGIDARSTHAIWIAT